MRRFCSVVAFAAVVLGASQPLAAQHWRPGERTLITEFDHVGAVATDLRHVYGATPNGLIVYDRFARAWRPPSTFIDGYPIGQVPTALAHEQFTGDLWLGTRSGVIWRYSTSFNQWNQATIVPGPVRAIGFGGEDAFILAGDEWLVSRAGMFAPERVPAGEVPVAVRDRASGAAWAGDPFLRTTLNALPPDPAGNRWRALAITPDDRRGTWWIGTDGGGLLHYDSRSNTAEWLQYGIPSTGATLVAQAAGMLWFAGQRDAWRPGIAVADTALARWQRVDARESGGPADVVYDVITAHDRVWLGAADGLHSVRMADVTQLARRGVWTHTDALDGLPDARVYALAPTSDGVWAATARGLVRIDSTGAVAANDIILPGTAIWDVALQGSTLWAATARGLVTIDAAGGVSVLTAAAPAELGGAVRGVVVATDEVWALTADGVHRRAASGEWRTYREPALAGIGALRRIDADADGVTIAAEQGMARWQAADGVWRYYVVPADIPAGPVASAIRVHEHFWLGTPAGALRLPLAR